MFLAFANVRPMWAARRWCLTQSVSQKLSEWILDAHRYARWQPLRVNKVRAGLARPPRYTRPDEFGHRKSAPVWQASAKVDTLI